MKITIEHIERLLADESDKIDELKTFASVSPDIYPMLYVAARNREVTVSDALIASRHFNKTIRFLIDKVFTGEDKDDVFAVVKHLDHHPVRGYYAFQAVYILERWERRFPEAPIG